MENKDNQLLNLKVMRLSKPHIPINNTVLCERDDLASDILLPPMIQLGNNDTNGGGIEALGVSSMLQLQSGIIYLGEIFTSYISLNNHSTHDVTNVFLKVELQTSTQRILLLDSEQQPIPKFGPGFNSDFVVQREVKESGVNILCCAVNYTTPENEIKKFKKFFKFQVMNPLIIKTKIHNLPSQIFLEACLENATQGALFLETIQFEPTELFNISNINENNCITSPSIVSNTPSITVSTASPSSSTGFKSSVDSTSILSELRSTSNVVFLKEGGSRQYLFKITPKDQNDFETKNSASLGKLDITWRSYLGEIGRLKTAFIQRKINIEEVECVLTHIPKVELERPFIVTVKIINKTNRILYPMFVLVRNKMDGILINGHLPKISSLQPNSSIDLDVEMFPIKAGMQQIVGLAIKLLEPSANDVFINNNVQQQQQQQQPVSVAATLQNPGQYNPMNNNALNIGGSVTSTKNYYELGVLADVFVENNNSSSTFFTEINSNEKKQLTGKK